MQEKTRKGPFKDWRDSVNPRVYNSGVDSYGRHPNDIYKEPFEALEGGDDASLFFGISD